MLKALLKSPWCVLFTFLILSFVVPAQLSAQNPLFGPKKPRLFKSPDGLFSIQLPGKWQVSDFRPGQSATFKPIGARVETQLMVQKINVPPGAHPRLLRLKAIENRLGRLPGFKELAKADAMIGGYPAAAITASYHYQGNIQYPRALEEVFIVAGQEAFILHFECFEPDGSSFAAAIGTMYQSFQIRPDQPIAPKTGIPQKSVKEEDTGSFVDKVPY
ncbi:MAG: hypothetical protein HOK97_01275 [Deltaproteobacteria bacterium]|jgi:hypothetical protein|nr:hypothetical protein [Deltaproteobacteria bacterium]MBT6488365.1 hypothetical protein [Deltaproteobacteria bacterium]